MKTNDILKLAESHGLRLKDGISFNEMGIDFRVVFATDLDGQEWVLRIPRRDGLTDRIEQEKKILELAKKHLSVSVPDWKIASPELIAYPLLTNKPVLTFDENTYEVTWNIDPNDRHIHTSLAKVLVELHRIPTLEAEKLGLKSQTPESTRQEVWERIERVKRELGIGGELESRWKKWVDNDRLWPDFSTFIHGDLYAGHLLAKETGEITGIIDWSEGQVGDPSTDFSGHMSVFGEESLRELIANYKDLGGKVWDNLFEQSVERHAAAPLNYAIFALDTNLEKHIEAVKPQLGLG